ncbi:MAG TPA: diaminopimelate decarboxylase [Cryomorphaceae bacterium]|nr:diaminopimelate decarboxylase [Cryomorphaceae bacterium]
MNTLREEALWAVEAARHEGWIGEGDTSVLFHSWTQQKRYLDHLTTAFSHPRALHAVAIKTQPHVEILRRVVAWGYGLEAASMEEVQLARKAGCPPERIVFDSPVKTRREIEQCQEELHGIRFNVNTLEELHRLPSRPHFPVGIRINPMVETGAPSVYHVSHDESKFGVPIAQKSALLEAILAFPVTQLHVHSGSSMARTESAVSAIRSVVDLAQEANGLLANAGLERRIDTLDIGGGLMPEILTDSPSAMMAYAQALRGTCPELWNYQLITEFGQWSYFYTGYAFSDVEYAVQRGGTRVAYVHLGADFLLRDAYVKPRGIEFIPLGDAAKRPIVRTDMAGPLCFAGDYLQKEVLLPQLEEGDGLLMLNTGSNAYALWSRHCSRTIPAVLGVDSEAREIRRLSPRSNPFV